MKTLLTILLVNSSCLAVSERLLDAIEQVESGGNYKAIGDGRKALGSFQLHKIYVDEANRILGFKKFSYIDRLNRNKSREITRTVLNHYQQLFKLSDLQVARCHNGGIFGYRNPQTIAYMKRVERAMR